MVFQVLHEDLLFIGRRIQQCVHQAVDHPRGTSLARMHSRRQQDHLLLNLLLYGCRGWFTLRKDLSLALIFDTIQLYRQRLVFALWIGSRRSWRLARRKVSG